ncbi:LPS-assembly protein LptD [Bacteroidales bacterium OttesenSCG-928-M11]|nr:LPS-assembly protein LptD [Bacteroidales bacterium OttesenSCG-928-M11]
MKKIQILVSILLLFFIGFQYGIAQEVLPDSVDISLQTQLLPDSTALDIQTEEIQADTTTKKRSSGTLEAPLKYHSQDSTIMNLKDNFKVFFYNDVEIEYMNANLKGAYVEVDADSSIILATHTLDSIGEEIGHPVFKDGNSEPYEMKKVRYNFNTKKMFITDVISKQGEGYLIAHETKKLENDDLFISNGIYTTCDDPDCKHYYFQLTKARARPNKNIVTGPAYLVVEGVSLPIAIPFGFFPFSSDYSSGIIMPSFDDELKRGFSLRNGGYYFAFNDYADLALTGEIYTKGSWGLAAHSTYRKRYKFSGNFNASYLYTVLGDKGANDYSQSRDFKVSWSHSQDSKAHPFRTFSASVNFSTSSYNQNSIDEMYTSSANTNTKASTVTYSYKIPESPFTISANASISQNSRDTTLAITLPNLTINMRDIYPFKKKERVGAPQWYENIRLSYSGELKNSISNVKEYDIMHKNIIKDWNNGMKHTIPISATFNLFKYLSVTPSFNYTERWYTSKVNRGYDDMNNVVTRDTVYGFNRLYNYNASISMSTKIYGFYKPLPIFGKWTKNSVIRHVITPSVSFTGAPDFSDKKYGYYQDLVYYDQRAQMMDTLTYSPYEGFIMGTPESGRSGTLNLGLTNNLEMKIPAAGSDSTKKISLIDNLSFRTSYNFLKDSLKWSDLNVSLRLKFSKSYTLSLNGVFDVYTYDYNEATGRINKVNVTRLEAGKGLARLKQTSTSFSYSINNSTVKKWFSKGNESESGETTPEENPLDTDTEVAGEETSAFRKKKDPREGFGDDGYWSADNISWNLSLSASLGLGYGEFNKKKKEYSYKVTPNISASGNISPTKNWNFSFSSSYDFEANKFSTISASITRTMHCWNMSANMVINSRYQSYHFTIAVNASMLRDLKYTQSSNSYDSMNWGY